MADSPSPGGMPFRMFLPATSANLGPAFDAAALAFDFGLRVEAAPAAAFSIDAHGRNADLCGKMPNNLIVDTYTKLLEREGKPVMPLAIRLDNDIPLGMGCGSSAAAVLASVAMAAYVRRARLGRRSHRLRGLSLRRTPGQRRRLLARWRGAGSHHLGCYSRRRSRHQRFAYPGSRRLAAAGRDSRESAGHLRSPPRAPAPLQSRRSHPQRAERHAAGARLQPGSRRMAGRSAERSRASSLSRAVLSAAAGVDRSCRGAKASTELRSAAPVRRCSCSCRKVWIATKSCAG